MYRTTRRGAAKLHQNLTGGLPFEAKQDGTPRKARPLAVRKTALSMAQATSESKHQQDAVTWLRHWGRFYPALLRTFHVANEFHAHDAMRKVNGATGRVYYSSASGAKRKAEGVKPGMLDLYNLGRSPLGYPGLAVDAKARDGELSAEPEKEWDQVREYAWLVSQGVSAHVAWSWAEIAALHAWYFQLKGAQLVASIGRLDIYLTEKGGHDQRCPCGAVNLERYLQHARGG